MKDITALTDFNNFLMDCHQARYVKIQNLKMYMFQITMSRPVDSNDYSRGYVTLLLRYLMQEFTAYASITQNPLPTYEQMSQSFIEIPQSFVDQIKKNESFKKTLRERLAEYAAENGRQDISFSKVFDVLSNRPIRVSRNNMIAKVSAENAIKKAKEKAKKDAIKAAAEKYGSNQEWSYYREWYRGPSSPAHDDDYEGSGKLDFADVALSLCTTEEQVKKLASQPVGFSITTEVDHYRTYYRRTK